MNKIAHIIPSLGCGGLEKVVVSQIQNMPHINHYVIIITDDDFSLINAIPPHAKIIKIHKKPGKDFSSHWRVFRALMKIRPDAVSTYNFGTIEYHLVAKLSGMPRTIHVDHGYGGDEPSGKNALHNHFRRVIQLFIDRYIVVSKDLFAWAEHVIGINTRKLRLIPNGIPDAPPSEIVQTTDRLSNSDFNIVSIGRLVDIKNQSFMIDSIGNWANTIPHRTVNLRIVGDGELRESLNILAKSKMISSPNFHVYFDGLQSHPWSFIEQWTPDVFLLTSKYEAMPLTILEAMLRGIPVAAPRVGGIPDLLPSKIYYGFDLTESSFFNAMNTALNEPSNQRTSRISNALEFTNTHYGFKEFLSKYENAWFN